MSFPSVVSTASGWNFSPTTESVSIPAGSVGDLLVVVYVIDVPAGEPPPPDLPGFTLLSSVDTGTTAQVYLKVSYKTATTSGATSVSFDVTGSNTLSWATYRIANGGAMFSATASNSLGSQPDPPNLSTGTVDDYLVFAAAGWLGSASVSTYPYPSNQITEGWSLGSQLAVCTNQLNISSTNPGAFTLSSSPEWAAITLAVAPAGPVIYGNPKEEVDRAGFSGFTVAPHWAQNLDKPDTCTFSGVAVAPYGRSVEQPDICTFSAFATSPAYEGEDTCTFSAVVKPRCSAVKIWVAGYWITGVPRVYAGGHWNNFPGVKVYDGTSWVGCD